MNLILCSAWTPIVFFRKMILTMLCMDLQRRFVDLKNFVLTLVLQYILGKFKIWNIKCYALNTFQEIYIDIHCHPLASTVIHWHPLSFIDIPLSYIDIHWHSLPVIEIHCLISIPYSLLRFTVVPLSLGLHQPSSKPMTPFTKSF